MSACDSLINLFFMICLNNNFYYYEIISVRDNVMNDTSLRCKEKKNLS